MFPPPALKYIQLKLDLTRIKKTDEKGKSKTQFCENTFALIRKFFCSGREEDSWPFIHFEIDLLALGYQDLSVKRDIYILIYHTTFALERLLTNSLH